MGRSDEYRRYAAECLEMASVVHDLTARATAGQGGLQHAELQNAEEEFGQGER
jgi:hypothetical protein